MTLHHATCAYYGVDSVISNNFSCQNSERPCKQAHRLRWPNSAVSSRPNYKVYRSLASYLLIALISSNLSPGHCFPWTSSEQSDKTQSHQMAAPHIDPECSSRTRGEHDDSNQTNELEEILLTLKCDIKPLLLLYESILPHYGGPQQISTPNDFLSVAGIDQSDRSSFIWRDYFVFLARIDSFYSEATELLSRKEFCTYPTIRRYKNLQMLAFGSTLLSNLFDVITIESHKICVVRALNNLPQVPHFIRDVISIYIGGADTQIINLNDPAPVTLSENLDGNYQFDLETAIAKSGPLSSVMSLVLDVPRGRDPEEAFEQTCREFVLKIEESWQSMEMMNEMLSTQVNGIKRLNNYVMRQVAPTKYADICSQLCYGK